jgi:DNA-binding GntR family transcriptional regulator
MFSNEKEFTLDYPVSLVEQINNFLTDSIIEGHLEPGHRLVETKLQEKFGTSRGPIRESFRVLEKNGFLRTIPRKGTFVRNVTIKDIEENFPIRANLERLAAGLAVPRVRKEEIDRMELALSKMRKTTRKKDFKSYLQHHAEFHEILIKTSRNDTLIEILENLRRQSMWFRLLFLYVQESITDALIVHRDILDRVINRDADGAGNLIEEHILVARDRFCEFLSSKTQEISGDDFR